MNDFAWKDKIVDMPDRKIDIHTANGELEIILDRYEWFYSSMVEGNSICVYVQSMSDNVSKLVPDVFYGHQVKLGFASYLTCCDKYGKKNSMSEMISLLGGMD
jgi:hypothetical protein